MLDSTRRLRTLAVFLGGLLTGVAVTVGTYLFLHRNTLVYEARETVIASGIVIPKGTKLIHDEAMSEGFDRLTLHINIDPEPLGRLFIGHIDDRGLLVIPYWVNDNESARTVQAQTGG